MYQNFFGFKERPFQLVPNPAYFFLSPSHEEAMAHLTYATSQGDGFAVITGEVGTGKTTLCRAFVESLDERTEIAYIFNSKLNALELLQTICDEFGLQSDANTIKAHIDSLNAFLIAQKTEGKQSLLIIDEAQNLTQEVLEQIRLLSNLETNTEKLIQIILVGQPEMADVLDSYELRQLGQRITLSCHINPLTYKETREYIQHRIRIASRNEGIPFTRAALKKIYAFSRGIPRLIHIVCDRALLTAYGLDQRKITGSIAQKAVLELSVRGDIRKLRRIERRNTFQLSALFAAILALLFVFKPDTIDMKHAVKAIRDFQISLPEKPPATSPPMSPPETEKAPLVSPLPPPEMSPEKAVPAPRFPAVYDPSNPSLPSLLRSMGTNASMEIAITTALSLWQPAEPMRYYTEKKIVDDDTYFTLTARENGFLVEKIEGNFELVKKLGLPAIVGFSIPGNMRSKYLALYAVYDTRLVFRANGPKQEIEMTPEQFSEVWSGIAYVPWINFYDYKGTTPISGPAESILILKKMLRRIGYSNLDQTPRYDSATKAAVKAVQSKYAITADGFVGPLTKIILYNEQPDLDIPRIYSQMNM